MVEVHLAFKLVHKHPTFNNLKEAWLRTPHGSRVEAGKPENKSKPEVRTGFEPKEAACKHNALTIGYGYP